MFLVPLSRDSRPLARLFDDAFEHFVNTGTGVDTGLARCPALDVAESDLAYTVKLDMPGVARDDVTVTVEGRQVSVQAHGEKAEEKKEGDRVVYRERSATRYSRSFTLPSEVDPSTTQARLEQGVLTLTLPKRGTRAAAQIAVS